MGTLGLYRRSSQKRSMHRMGGGSITVQTAVGGAFSCFIRPLKVIHALCLRGSFREDQPSGGRVRITSAMPPRGDLAKSRSCKPNDHLTQATSRVSLGTYTLPRSRMQPTA